MLVTPDGAWHATPPPTTVVSTVGAGDSSLFGYLLGDIRGLPAPERLALAVAYGSAAAGLPGTTIPQPSQLRTELVGVTALTPSREAPHDRTDHHRPGAARRRLGLGQARRHPRARRRRRRRRPSHQQGPAHRGRVRPRGDLRHRPPGRHRDPALPHGRGRGADARLRAARAARRLRRQGRPGRPGVPDRRAGRRRRRPPHHPHQAGPRAGQAGLHRRAARRRSRRGGRGARHPRAGRAGPRRRARLRCALGGSRAGGEPRRRRRQREPTPRPLRLQVSRRRRRPIQRKPSLVAVTACPTGIAHTYMAAEALEAAAERAGVELAGRDPGLGGRHAAAARHDLPRRRGDLRRRRRRARPRPVRRQADGELEREAPDRRCRRDDRRGAALRRRSRGLAARGGRGLGRAATTWARSRGVDGPGGS